MTKNYKQYLIFFSIGLLCLIIYAFRLNNYLIMELFFEAKYAASLISINSFSDIYHPLLNNVPIYSVAPLYYLLIKLFSLPFGNYSECSIRIFSGITLLFTVFGVFYALSKIVSKKYSIILTMTSFSSLIFVIFSTINSPYMISACFSILSIIFGMASLLINIYKLKKIFYYLFWFFIALSVLTTNIYSAILPVLTIFPLAFLYKNSHEFYKLSSFIKGTTLFVLLVLVFIYPLLGTDYIKMIFPALNFDISSLNIISNYKFFLKYSLIYFTIGSMPWFFFYIIFLVTGSLILCKNFLNFKTILSTANFDNSIKILIFSVWSFLVSLVIYVFCGITDFPRLTSCLFFGGLICGFLWYKYIYDNKYEKLVSIASSLLYFLLITISIAIIIATLFINTIQKTYLEPLTPPIVYLTLFVAIPGMIAVLIKRKFLNFAVQIFFSILLFFLSTGLFYNYVNSFGENDLVNISIKAREDNVKLVTYDIMDKYAMIYYFKAPVEFNKMISADEIYQKYGNTRNTYIVLKHTDLTYFDKFFVYEIVTTGKVYCGITNIKYLPVDEVTEDPEAQPSTVL